jgi:hypothetical protein
LRVKFPVKEKSAAAALPANKLIAMNELKVFILGLLNLDVEQNGLTRALRSISQYGKKA